jgi:hypothetical protein
LPEDRFLAAQQAAYRAHEPLRFVARARERLEAARLEPGRLVLSEVTSSDRSDGLEAITLRDRASV